MGVQLNIKDADTIRMARELAASSGRTVTAVIREALAREMDDRSAKVRTKIDDVKRLLGNVDALWKDDWTDKSSKEIMDSIYDENGLPQ